LKGVRENLWPVRTESAFVEKGMLTPDEFVAAGDLLVRMCPTWSWQSGDPLRRRPYLPEGKQYLVTRGVPCHERVADAQKGILEEGEEEQGEWLAPSVAVDDGDAAVGASRGAGASADDEYADIVLTEQNQGPIISGAEDEEPIGGGIDLSKALMDDYVDAQGDIGGTADPGSIAQEASGVENDNAENEYADLADFEDTQIELDEATLMGATQTGKQEGYVFASDPEHEQGFVRPRTYDVSISYDKYYATPRIWLFGYNEDGQPLAPEETFEDVVEDYRDRTVTIDPHPHSGVSHASIHPCQHGATMRRLLVTMMSGGLQPRPEQYMLIFLKFIQSVVPTIQYDYTGSSVILEER